MNMPGILRLLKTKLLDDGGIEEIFSHLRNLILTTVVNGIYKLTRLGSHLALKIALAAVYLLISIRLIYFVVLLRGG